MTSLAFFKKKRSYVNELSRLLYSYLAKPHVIFLIISSVAGGAFILLTPPLWGLDEPSHFARAFKISQGEIVPVIGKDSGANVMPENFNNLSNLRTDDILDVPHSDSILKRADVTDINAYHKFTAEHFSKEAYYYPYVATYSPVAYPGAVLGILVADLFHANIGQTLFLTRLFNLVLYILIAALAIYAVRNYLIKWLFLLVALLPTAIFQSAVVTADSTLIGLSLLFFALLYRTWVDKKKTKKSILFAIAICAIMMPLIKINYLLISVLILLLPSRGFMSRRSEILYKISVMIGSVVSTITWSRLTKVTDEPEFTQRGDDLLVSPGDQIAHVMHHPIEFIMTFIKSFVVHGDSYYSGLLFTISGNSVKAPLILIVVLSLVLIGVAIAIKKELLPLKRQIIWINIAALITALTVFAALYAGFTPVGWGRIEGVQGRYFLPMLIPLLMLIGIFAPVELKMNKRVMAVMSTLVIVTCLTASILYIRIALY